MNRTEAITSINGAFQSACLDRCVSKCGCDTEAREALAALGVSDAEVEAVYSQ